jgi:hypothetical protein
MLDERRDSAFQQIQALPSHVMSMRCAEQRLDNTKNGKYLAAAGYNRFVIATIQPDLV